MDKIMCDLDLHVGDMVQIRPHAKAHAGEVGRVIGIKAVKKWYDLSMTVKFADNSSADFFPCYLILLRSVKPNSGKKEVHYEKR